MDMIEWGVRNSHRIDVQFQKDKDRHGHLQLTGVLAPDERPVESGTAILTGQTAAAAAMWRTTARIFCCLTGWGATTVG